jgi:hypothetical protein
MTIKKIVSEFEKNNNYTLPDDYKLFLELSFGLIIKLEILIPIEINDIQKGVTMFQNDEQTICSLWNFDKNNYGLNLESMNYNLHFALGSDITYLFKNYIAIGEDNSGHTYPVIDVSGCSKGVYYWWDETMVGVFDINLFPKIATSFTSFLKLLIDQNGGYIENLSEIYQELVKKGFK